MRESAAGDRLPVQVCRVVTGNQQASIFAAREEHLGDLLPASSRIEQLLEGSQGARVDGSADQVLEDGPKKVVVIVGGASLEILDGAGNKSPRCSSRSEEHTPELQS